MLVLSIQLNGYPRGARTAFEALKTPDPCATIKRRRGRDETATL